MTRCVSYYHSIYEVFFLQMSVQPVPLSREKLIFPHVVGWNHLAWQVIFIGKLSSF